MQKILEALEASPKDSPEKTLKNGADYNARQIIDVPFEYGGMRIDIALVKLFPAHSRSRLQAWIKEGLVQINGFVCVETKRKLIGGEKIIVDTKPSDELAHAQAENIPFPIVFEDESLIILNKPAGLVVHPGNGNQNGTLLNALLHYAPHLREIPRAGIVHRLDKDTTGLMVVAKTLEAQTSLVRQLQARQVKRYYRALVRGIVESDDVIDAPIGRHPKERVKMAVTEGKNGKPARTHFRVIERFNDCTLIDCALETGRTHQIRVHLDHIFHPLVGDPVYGGGNRRIRKGPDFPRQALHARLLAFIHPKTELLVNFVANVPEDLRSLIAEARFSAQVTREAKYAEEENWDELDGVEVIYANEDYEDEDE